MSLLFTLGRDVSAMAMVGCIRQAPDGAQQQRTSLGCSVHYTISIYWAGGFCGFGRMFYLL